MRASLHDSGNVSHFHVSFMIPNNIWRVSIGRWRKIFPISTQVSDSSDRIYNVENLIGLLSLAVASIIFMTCILPLLQSLVRHLIRHIYLTTNMPPKYRGEKSHIYMKVVAASAGCLVYVATVISRRTWSNWLQRLVISLRFPAWNGGTWLITLMWTGVAVTCCFLKLIIELCYRHVSLHLLLRCPTAWR